MIMRHFIAIFISFIGLISPLAVSAQCAMCKATVENNENATIAGDSLNSGIIYLMAIPYFLLAIFVGAIIYTKRKKLKNV